MQLPQPSRQASVSSKSLVRRIISHIEMRGGWMPFSEYMDMALYAPGLGYYTGGSANFGEPGDFTTAPEMTPIFGQTLAKAMVALAGKAPLDILELGAGTGALASAVLGELDRLDIPLRQYAILDVSPELKQRQKRRLSGYSHVAWIDALPGRIDGMVLANEVLDAMPVDLVVFRDSAWFERGVTCEKDRLVFADRPAGSALCEAISFQLGNARFPEGYVTEIHARACAFVRTLAKSLARGTSGAAIFIDYGFPAREYYHGQRAQGTLMCHYRHHAHDDPFFLPGLQDITSHLDFSALAKAGEEEGLDVLCYAPQAGFLVASGLVDIMERDFGRATDGQRAQMARAIDRLLSPAEMGELFKVLVLGHNLQPPGFLLDADRSGRL